MWKLLEVLMWGRGHCGGGAGPSGGGRVTLGSPFGGHSGGRSSGPCGVTQGSRRGHSGPSPHAGAAAPGTLRSRYVRGRGPAGPGPPKTAPGPPKSGSGGSQTPPSPTLPLPPRWGRRGSSRPLGGAVPRPRPLLTPLFSCSSAPPKLRPPDFRPRPLFSFNPGPSPLSSKLRPFLLTPPLALTPPSPLESPPLFLQTPPLCSPSPAPFLVLFPVLH